jgi:CP family cyanate transporter-like MFS transporter
MRAGLVLIGPLIPILKSYFDLSNAAISLLAGIPVVCFAATSILMKQVAKLGSSNRIIKWALTFLTVALIARAFTGLIGLYVFTVLMGISIAIMNYEIPAWVKEHAPERTGLITGIYVTLMGIAGSIAVAVSVPLAQLNELSWKFAMIPWMLVAVLASAYWWIFVKSDDAKPEQLPNNFWKSKAFKNPIAWCLAFFFGTESMTFYATATWFPTILTTKEFTLREAAIAVSISGIIGSVVGLTVPHYVAKVLDQRLIIAAVTIMTGIAFFMISVQSGSILYLWLTLSNIGISIIFPIVLMQAGFKSDSSEATRNLSTMFQSLGYLLSATGPFVLGQVHDLTNDWNKAMLVVVAMTILQLIFGIIVGKPRRIDF